MEGGERDNGAFVRLCENVHESNPAESLALFYPVSYMKNNTTNRLEVN